MYNVWNSFVITAKNSTFLFQRDYMDYHSDRFDDYSIMVFDSNNLIAVLPANLKGDKLYSHQGLTYGGLVFTKELKFRIVSEIFKQLLAYLSDLKIEVLQLNLLPDFYSRYGNNEIEYLLFLSEAKLLDKRALSVINLKSSFIFSKNRLEGYKRGVKHGLLLRFDDKIEDFWKEILLPNLENKYQSKPVHTLEEIVSLKNKFPDNIIQVNIYRGKEIVAGTTLFISKNVVKTQYISGNSENNSLGSLDYLIYKLLNDFFEENYYFDFGTSSSNNKGQINKGLYYWKEGFGARTITQDIYEVNTNNYKLLNNILV